MRKILVTILTVTILLTTTASALTLSAQNKVEVEAGKYLIHYIYRSESYWTTKELDKEVIEEKDFKEDTKLNFSENKGKYNYMCVMVGDEKDGITNIYVWYNNYKKE